MISIIIVNYKVEKELYKCIESIYDSKQNISFEIIVVDNDKTRTIEKKLKKRFPKVIYVFSKKNIGYGAGNNLGQEYAKGEYLFFLNPDTYVKSLNLKELLDDFKFKNAGIIAPTLIINGKESLEQGSIALTPLVAIFKLSFIDKLYPNNPISKEFWVKNHKNKLKQVDVVPGTALIISKELFLKIGKFDERFFLYFEEYDLCRRVRKLGYNIFIDSDSKIVHEWGKSTSKLENIDKIFNSSRYLYFRKHFGLIKTLLVEFFLRINKVSIFITFLLATALFLRIYNLSISMPFIGDQGWFYLSARDMLLTGKIPLVGITSSHTWLHQGPLWTYILSAGLYLSNFNPFSGGYITALFGVGTVYLMYKMGSNIFSRRVGLISAFLYTTSPLVIIFDRQAFDPSLMPFFTVLYFFSLVKLIRGERRYLPLSIFILVILYNLELASFTLIIPFLLVLFFLFKFKTGYLKTLFSKNLILLSIFAFLIPMTPILIYDFSNGFKQTLVFAIWIGYKFLGLFFSNHSGGISLLDIYRFITNKLQILIFAENYLFANLLFVFSILYLIFNSLKNKSNFLNSKFILLLFILTTLAGVIVNKTPSDAYLPISFPFIIFAIAILFDHLYNNKYLKYFSIFVLFVIFTYNFNFIYKQSFAPEIQKRQIAVQKIIALTNGSKYNLSGKGMNSQFESFTMNYEYLLWWKGHQPSKVPQKMQIVISEESGGIMIDKYETK